MTADVVVPAITVAVSAAVVLYLVWSNRHRNEEWERKHDQEHLRRDLLRDLDHNETASIRRHSDLQRQLAEHHRILKYLARRLS